MTSARRSVSQWSVGRAARMRRSSVISSAVQRDVEVGPHEDAPAFEAPERRLEVLEDGNASAQAAPTILVRSTRRFE